jgi:hypothetical protein
VKRLFFAIVLVLLAGSTFAGVLADAEIRKILVDRIDGQHRGVGIVVGILDPSGRRMVTY